MAQGLLLKKHTSSSLPIKKKTRTKNIGLKKGARVIAPKKQGKIKRDAIRKKLTTAINKDIETKMAIRAVAVGGGKQFNIVKIDDSDAKELIKQRQQGGGGSGSKSLNGKKS
ncbi:2158_t:CDS:1 [Ambispora gerdemannii]|uniref:2158_t:CDS:1 n=1 Tax=Ambispora gerdemannii TaxID=144530 RepID=A0A9N9CPH2_9GLOM|nr:2158_t:CDS:1 [Ambispora gerdemannii]